MDSARLNDLFYRYIHQACTREEELELMQLLADPELAPAVESLVGDCYDQLPVTYALSGESADTIFQQIINGNNRAADMTQPTFRLRRMMVRFAAAAAIIVLVSAVVWFFMLRTQKNELATKEQTGKPLINDVIPGGNKAVLILADNKRIVLDSAANGQLAQQGSSVVSKAKDGELRYESGIGKSEIAYNTLATPRGGQYQLVLPDGSKIWLNAASSIRYPTAFAGNERSVDITGEAYFEVAKDAKKPFRVHFVSKDREGAVEVLGTHFNINAYDDEPAIKTTLLEGSVKVSKDAASAILKPGQQVSISQTSQLSHPIPVQTDEVVAWKNGLFLLNEAEVVLVMRQLARWYDVEFSFPNGIPKGRLTGDIPRSTNLSQVLKVLELSGIHFRIEGRKVVVFP